MKRQTQSLDDLTKFTDLSILTKNVTTGDESSDSEDGNASNFSRKKRKSRSFGKSRSGEKQKGSFKRRR